MTGTTIDIKTDDGVADAYLTRPEDGETRGGVLLLMDAFGLRPVIEEMADRIAAQGYVVLAPNLLYREGRAPLFEMPDLTDPDQRAAFFEKVRPMMASLTPERIVADGALLPGPTGAGDRWPGGADRLLHGRADRLEDRHRLPRPGRGPRRLSRRRAGHRGPRQSAPIGRSARRAAVLRPRRQRSRAIRPSRSRRSTRHWTGRGSPIAPRSMRARRTGTRWPTRRHSTSPRASATSPRFSAC